MKISETNVRFLWRKFFDTETYRYYQKLSKSSDKCEQNAGLKFIAGYAAGVSAVVDSYHTEESRIQLQTVMAIKEQVDLMVKQFESNVKYNI